ncbi:ABC transporter permease [Pseudoalteromonas denitrificans]|uniref:FtsX-like permease family protein n=1 Tax=Pseudoalteromonas denitrificans DSM 6059 TaxID=1123010 RepID=A0A1I1EL50_9GAMM|nr:ABC transporter permease [Pseudoalteromonas denitrificans]SFB87791.1 FtsX-like permease family protein [Pseudoalteromonas denitrificans DSM 6059]
MSELIKQVLHSLKHKKNLNILMVFTIAIGIALMTTMMTIAHQELKISLPDKSDNVHLIMLDNRELDAPVQEVYAMPRTTYKDVENIFSSNPGTLNLVRLWETRFIAEPEELTVRPMRLNASAVNNQLFDLMEMPFIYGNAWSLDDQKNSKAVIVIDKTVNDAFFGGANSVGKRILIEKKPMTIVGVMDISVHPKRFQNRNFSTRRNDQAFIPYTFALENNLNRVARIACPKNQTANNRLYRNNDVAGLKASECGFEVLWAEFKDKKQSDAFFTWLNAYAQKNKEMGRFFQDKIVYALSLSQMMAFYGDNDWTQTLAMLSYLLFAVCIVNTSGIMLAKFQSKAKLVSLYRALGATKNYIVKIHFFEVIIISFIGILLGLVLSKLGLHIMYEIARYQSDYLSDPKQLQALYSIDWNMIIRAASITTFSVIAAGIYPIWRISNLAPASQLRGA